ncbi:hypothetical protein niasHT_008635 [Heterodera trifolii]|uniref:Uncharacterized protein n=1 Tax=Heterodera trifolii TaxID=157864 RepID=A0ABD2LW25_9BILA
MSMNRALLSDPSRLLTDEEIWLQIRSARRHFLQPQAQNAVIVSPPSAPQIVEESAAAIDQGGSIQNSGQVSLSPAADSVREVPKEYPPLHPRYFSPNFRRRSPVRHRSTPHRAPPPRRRWSPPRRRLSPPHRRWSPPRRRWSPVRPSPRSLPRHGPPSRRSETNTHSSVTRFFPTPPMPKPLNRIESSKAPMMPQFLTHEQPPPRIQNFEMTYNHCTMTQNFSKM